MQAIEGYHIGFITSPFRTRHPHGITHTQAESNLIENEVQDLLTKRGHPPSSSGAETRRVCQQPVSCPQKRGWSETSHKFKAFKSIREVRALQNGEYSHATRSTKKRRLSGQNRFEGCLLHGPYLGKLPEISEVSLEGDSLRVCMPSTPTCFSPAGFHQGNESKPVVGLLRQLGIRIVIYLDDMLTIGQTQERAKCHATTKYKPPRKSEVHCQLPEVSSNTFNHNRISGVSSGLKNFEFISSKGEDKECQKGMPINSRRSTAFNTTTFPIVGLPNFHHSGSLSCTNSFSVFTNRQNKALSTCQDYSATFSLSQHAKDQLIW